MRYVIFTLSFLIITLSGCNDEELAPGHFRDDPFITSLNGTWRVVSFEDLSTHTVEYPTQENSWNLGIVVTFNDNLDPKKISGTNTTNSIFGKFDYVDDRKFIVQQLGSTYVAQPQWADKFASAMLNGPKEFKINSRILRVYYDDNTRSVTLERQ